MSLKSYLRGGMLILGLHAATFFSAPAYSSPIDINPEHLFSRSINGGGVLRILPLGDSITWGYLSSDGNGYRLDLENLLAGNTVQYVGSQQSGNMPDNYNEGHPGAVISEIATYAQASLPYRPNVVLLMAGTNDINRPDDPAGAPGRLGSLIDEIVNACPDAAVLVAQLTPFGNAAEEAEGQTFNAAVPGIVASRVSAGKKVLIVNMSAYLTVANLADGLHPNDGGYNLMAQAWLAGIKAADSNGWIKQPVSGTTVKHGVNGHSLACATNLYWDPVYGTIASGVGTPDTAFAAGWNPVGTLAGGYTGTGDQQGLGVRLADFNGDGIDDYAWVDPKSGAVSLFINGGMVNGKINWLPWGTIASGIGDGPGVIFADINGDGLDDYLWIAPNGDVTAYKNGGPGSGGAFAGTWVWIPLGVIASGLGGVRGNIKFADIDGDGRAEYLIVGPSGSLTGFLNSGFNDGPTWKPMGLIAGGVGDIAGVHLVDLNGDGRADYVWLDSNGKMDAYINYRGHGVGLAPGWIPAGIIATGVGTSRDNITFGDLNGDGKDDYVFNHLPQGQLDVWLNQGTGGTFVVADGTRFGDIDGDGRDDYLAIDKNGAIELYTNGGWDTVNRKWLWFPHGIIATGVGAKRQDIRIGDLDGDGKEDYLVVDEHSGAVTFWRNGGANSGAPNGWLWINMGEVASGIGPGVGVEFADIDGDGKVDYLWIDKNGATTLYINGGPNNAAPGNWIWYPKGIIASGVGAAREDVKFRDLNGDGRADYLWIDRTNGALQVWRNGGASSAANGGWIWYPLGEIASGVGANGLCIDFADLTGDGRDDYLDITPTSGAISMWYNGCSGTTGGGTSSPSPTSLPDSIPTAWMTVDCLNPGVTNAAVDQTIRWNDVDADDAFDAAVASWTANPHPGGLTFSEQISNFFHGPEQLLCGSTTDHNGCDSPIQCSDTNHPAGYFIINSFVAINNLNLNFYDAISRVEAALTAIMSTFQATFAPIDDQTLAEKIILDLIGLGFALVASPVWNSALKQFAYFDTNKNELGTLKDTINPLVSNGITIAKDTSSSSPSINAQNALEVNAANMIIIWYDTINFLNNQMFNGSSTSISQLKNMITGGKMLQPGQAIDDLTIQSDIEHAIYGSLIPQAWSLSNRGIHPFILDSGFPCSAVNPLPKYMSSDTGDQTYACINNKLYYLLSLTGSATTCDVVPCGISQCTQNYFSPPPGLSALNGHAYGGVTYQEFIIGSLNGYAANHNQNGWPNADPSSSSTVSALYDTGIETPGVVHIPVCSADVAYTNWLANNPGNTDANYPCEPLTSSKKRSVDEILADMEAFQTRQNFKRC